MCCSAENTPCTQEAHFDLISHKAGLERLKKVQATPINRVASGPGKFHKNKRRNLLTENILSQTVIPSYISREILTDIISVHKREYYNKYNITFLI